MLLQLRSVQVKKSKKKRGKKWALLGIMTRKGGMEFPKERGKWKKSRVVRRVRLRRRPTRAQLKQKSRNQTGAGGASA